MKDDRKFTPGSYGLPEENAAEPTGGTRQCSPEEIARYRDVSGWSGGRVPVDSDSVVIETLPPFPPSDKPITWVWDGANWQKAQSPDVKLVDWYDATLWYS